MKPGDRLGPYEIVATIGAGGMGEVFRARDARIQRDVAIKVLHADTVGDASRVQRFEIEARAVGSLNHPNLLVLFDVGTRDGAPYVVTELLNGESLRQRLQDGPLPIRQAVDIAAQTARGLGAAHEKGIIHRDLKPENLFLLDDRRVKILDFGLAKLTTPDSGDGVETTPAVTETGQTLGTVGYMAPEQVNGAAVSPATDLFALGAVLYEMVSGGRAFQGTTRVDTLRAILREEPPEWPPGIRVPPALDHIVRRCLAKRADERFRSAHDLAFALEMVSGSGSSPALAPIEPSRRRRWFIAMTAAAVAVAAVAAAMMLNGVRTPDGSRPTLVPITARRQAILQARFGPDGQTIIFSATHQEKDHEIFSARVGATEARALGIHADLFEVSKTGELALRISPNVTGKGTLARMPLDGGSPREVLTDVVGAEWSPTGDLAILREADGIRFLEYPIGTVLAQSSWMIGPAFSPSGNQLAFQAPVDGRPTLQVVDLTRPGPPRRVREFDAVVSGLCWGPGGDALRYILEGDGFSEVRSVRLDGTDRWLMTLPGTYVLQDCRDDGGMLVERMNMSSEIVAYLRGSTEPVDLSWLASSQVADLSRDAGAVLFREGLNPPFSTYLRATDGSAAIRLGEGEPLALSPDGQWALVATRADMVVLPIGAGQPRHFPLGALIRPFGSAGAWLRDGRRVTFTAAEPGQPPRCYAQAVDGGDPQPISPVGVVDCRMPSPDGRLLFVRGPAVFDLETQATRPVPGLTSQDTPIGWNEDSTGFFVAARASSALTHLVRIDMASGRRTSIRELRAAGPVGGGAGGVQTPRISADARTIIYSVVRYSSELMLVEGLR